MKRFVEGTDRGQSTLFPECLADWIDQNNPVQVIDAFVGELDLAALGFDGVAPEATGRPSYHPSVLLKLYIYGYLNRVQSSRRLEREAGRNIEVMWLTGRLVPDHKTIADFRKDNCRAISQVCARFIMLCRQLELFVGASVVIDGSKFKAVNNRDKNFTRVKNLISSFLPFSTASSNSDDPTTWPIKIHLIAHDVGRSNDRSTAAVGDHCPFRGGRLLGVQQFVELPFGAVRQPVGERARSD
jgi:transposase